MILGLGLILAGAHFLVEGSSSIARRFGISDFIIGMTIVGIGTSAPEMAISFLSAFKGNADIAVGNVLGSNIFNTLVILGVTGLIAPIALTSNNIKKDIPFSLLAAVILLTLGSSVWLDGTTGNVISRVSGIMLLSFFGVFMSYSIFSAKSTGGSAMSAGGAKECASMDVDGVKNESSSNISGKEKSIIVCIIMVIGGLAALVFGGDMFVNSAAVIAKKLGVSDAVIALTLMAGGTSLPELASCVVAAYKKNTAMALGNVIGSNVSNIFLILGGSAVINPLSMSNISIIDTGTLAISSLLVFIAAFTFKKKQIDRVESALFILIYIVYLYTVIGIKS